MRDVDTNEDADPSAGAAQTEDLDLAAVLAAIRLVDNRTRVGIVLRLAQTIVATLTLPS